MSTRGRTQVPSGQWWTLLRKRRMSLPKPDVCIASSDGGGGRLHNFSSNHHLSHLFFRGSKARAMETWWPSMNGLSKTISKPHWCA